MNLIVDSDPVIELGVAETFVESDVPSYTGSYNVTPSAAQQTLATNGKKMNDDVTVGAVQAGSASTPATSITANPSLSFNSNTGVVSANVSASESVTPTVSEGYVSSGTAGTVSVSGFANMAIPTESAFSITPVASETAVAVVQGKYMLGDITINPATYAQSDEGKVVQNGALQAQSSQTVNDNGTYDTTLKNSVTVAIPSASGVSF